MKWRLYVGGVARRSPLVPRCCSRVRECTRVHVHGNVSHERVALVSRDTRALARVIAISDARAARRSYAYKQEVHTSIPTLTFIVHAPGSQRRFSTLCNATVARLSESICATTLPAIHPSPSGSYSYELALSCAISAGCERELCPR